MILDLNLSNTTNTTVAADVCIIGAGTAGIFLAQRLCKHNIKNIVLLEYGDNISRKPVEMNQFCKNKGVRYHGADSGRSFGLGGTSVLWGGQMIPLAKTDMNIRNYAGFSEWPISYSEIKKYTSSVESQFGLTSEVSPDIDFSSLASLQGRFKLRTSQWLPFKLRNFSKAFFKELKHNNGLTVWTNAMVTKMDYFPESEGGKINQIYAKSPNGNRLLVKPKIVVVCAGALESTRLLLEFDELTNVITRQKSPLGKYFSDHLSVECGYFTCINKKLFNLAVAPVFRKSIMCSPRLEVAGNEQKKEQISSAFVHFNFITTGDTGLDLIRTILRKRQGERKIKGISFFKIGSMMKDIFLIFYWRFFYKRLWIPKDADLKLYVDIEQLPNIDSTLCLGNELDSHNRKLLVINWKIDKRDMLVLKKVANIFFTEWNRSSLKSIAT